MIGLLLKDIIAGSIHMKDFVRAGFFDCWKKKEMNIYPQI